MERFGINGVETSGSSTAFLVTKTLPGRYAKGVLVVIGKSEIRRVEMIL
jgi:hypothetical protein